MPCTKSPDGAGLAPAAACAPIGVFDSGVGGLSVVFAIRQRLPAESLYYAADSAFAPYGRQRAAHVLDRARSLTAWLLERGAKAIVVACNTATAVAIDHLRREFPVPIIGMEPAIKPAIRLTRRGVVGVLATAGTLQSDRYARLLATHRAGVQVLPCACHQWVEQVEGGAVTGTAVRAMVQRDLAPLLQAGADVLVLGCTHFPFLAPEIQAVTGPGVTLLDPAPAVADQLARQLAAQAALCTGTGAGSLTLVSSGTAVVTQQRLARLAGLDPAACGTLTTLPAA